MDIVKTFSDLAGLGAEWVLWLLVILSIVSIALILERMVYYKKISIDYATFSKKLQEFLKNGDFQGAMTYCTGNESIEAQTVLRALQVKDHGAAAMTETTASFLIGERQHLDRGLVVLGTLGNNAPFIGLFGTVIGIIVAFQDLALDTSSGASAVMDGISEALVATAVGLLVAIPAVIAYNGFNRVVKRRLANSESAVKMLTTYFISEKKA